MEDGELLERFIAARDGSAFEELVARHGPMVLGVCRHVLIDRHDAEDAFQATFLVLARQAGTIRDRRVLGAWLHGVAYRLALRAKLDAARRRMHERQVADMAAAGPWDELAWQELRLALHEEVQRLPEKYRAPIVLCYLEGQSHEAAAAHLDWPIGTVKGRLARARDLLQARLGRRELAIPATVCVAALSRDMAVVPAGLRQATVEAALRFAAGETRAISEQVTTWAEVAARRWHLGAALAEASRRIVATVAAGLRGLARRARVTDQRRQADSPLSRG
jgi:RNA polymerase sigma factor (sigma-70 family)